MGLQDRNYYDDQGRDPWSSDPDAWKGGSSGGGGFRGRSGNVIKVLIIINVVIFLLDAFSPVPEKSLELYQLQLENVGPEKASEVRRPARWIMSTLGLRPDVIQKPWNIWQLFTYGFAHASIDSSSSFFHVGFNMLTLFFLGRPVERRYGSDEFLRFYLVAIVVAGMGWLLVQWLTGNWNSSAVGASGAVSAVIALFVFNYWNETVHLFGVFGVKAWVVGLLVIGADLFNALNPTSHVAWEAHLAGMAFGAAYYHFKWNLSWLKWGGIKKALKPKPRLKVHNPDAADEALQEKADQVLDKIAREGEGSLSAKERKILNKYSKSLRKKKAD